MPKKIEGVCRVCGGRLKAKGLCDAHYQMNRKHGRTHNVIRAYDVGETCGWDGCKKQAQVCGYCRPHYKMARRAGILHPGKFERDHPLYGMWWARRKANVLGPEWVNNFSQFAVDIGTPPDKFYSLVTLQDGLFGPSNFKWHRQLKRGKGESLKAFHARKWEAQKMARPSWDNNRQIIQKYGITRERYDAMLKEQSGVCAICKNPETKMDYRHGSVKKLSIDHCHKTQKVRGLLCSRCNITIGQIEESVELLRSMEIYIQFHLSN